ncbi:MAG: glycosyltransferase family 4 protein [Candidatus Nanohaloarchaea archaeon]|nr:glycosyltransferase family 4 protein [Candidatus Nanohaloarchaea archaeon]
MKLAHLLTRFSPDEHPGGVERVVDELATRQAEEHDVEVICRNQFDDPAEEQRNGYTVRRAKVVDFSGLRTLSSFPSMRKLIQQSDADVFHIHDWSPYLNYRVAGSPAKSVLTLHNINEGLPQRILQRRSIMHADTVTCVTQELAGRVESRYGREAAVIHNGTDTETFTPGNEGDGVVFVGNLIESKGIKELCDAATALDLELTVVGDGPLRAELEDSFPTVDFVGEVPYSSVPEYLERAAYVALPSRTEGFGLAWIEALAAGKPVLCTDTGIGAEIPPDCGVRIPADYTQQELEEGLQELVGQDFDPDTIRSYAEDNFDWDNIAERYENEYRELV